MMDPFGIAGDLGADHPRSVAVVPRAAHAADGALVEHVDFQCAGRGAIVRTGGRGDPERHGFGAEHFIHCTDLNLRRGTCKVRAGL